MTRVLVLLALLVAEPAGAEIWHARAAIGNDAFTAVVPPLDDLGFTNDLALALDRKDGDYAFGGSIFHRMLTSRLGPERWDELDIVAIATRFWPYHVTTDAWLGPTFGGNFGGRALQNWWHSWSGTGPTIAQGLAHIYPGDRRVAALVGTRTAIESDTRIVRGYGTALGQLALGSTGVTRVELSGGLRLVGTLGGAHPGAHGELALTAYHVGDPNLALPGGYRPGLQLEWRVGVDVAWSRYRLSYEYRANESGSGEPIGVIAFDVMLP